MSRVRIREEVWVGEREGIVLVFGGGGLLFASCYVPVLLSQLHLTSFFSPLEKSLVMDGGIGINLVRTFRSHNKVHLVVKY